MSFVLSLFKVSLSVLFFCYIGYGILLFLFNSIRALFIPRRAMSNAVEWLPVTLVVAAYNEEAVLEQKLVNTFAIDYPPEKLHIIFITDGSSDDSVNIIQRYPSVTLLHQEERKGKSAAIQRAMQHVHTPVVIFSDANTILNKECIRKMVIHYQNPETGAVAGEKMILTGDHASAVGEAEGLYWQYESFMKKQDALFHTVIGAAGELYSIRTGLFKGLEADLLLDDFIISMQVCLQGFKIAYEPGAYASEAPSISLAQEEKRKVRIAAGAYQSIRYLKKCLQIFKHPLLSFQYISRRLLRWICCPPLLLVLLLTNLLIVINGSITGIYAWFLYGQLLFYDLALVGWFMVSKGRKAGLLTIPFYFVFMNYCLVKGFSRFLKGRQTVLWEKSLRQVVE